MPVQLAGPGRFLYRPDRLTGQPDTTVAASRWRRCATIAKVRSAEMTTPQQILYRRHARLHFRRGLDHAVPGASAGEQPHDAVVQPNHAAAVLARVGGKNWELHF